ncbi:DSBA-like thioredoxin domain protein [Candidatus Endolissoclinum faulkneri L2]|uniref:DSBA-like thioredoxin domain protein n=1 Tax=Candidatus Endolissoclinum faulkneri L2 TaxID=1193729 RepID=K7YQ07_9PROT|nr:DsbA family protein [Candidatus Endolissoclinum faulkneri]AFX98664.1 DSBA-like thioredoxin domain protein [Candidatus Endolissoclinum faulkneri L2]
MIWYFFSFVLFSLIFCCRLVTATDLPLSLESKSNIKVLIHNYMQDNGIVQQENDVIKNYFVMQRVEETDTYDIKQILRNNQYALECDPVDPVLGNLTGDVTVVEFFDYQCSYCKLMTLLLKELIEKDSNIRIVFKELPILSTTSETAALASLASHYQNKYMKFQTKLFDTPGQITQKIIFQVAQEIGLDIDRLKVDMGNTITLNQIRKSFELARILSIRGTPALVIGNYLIHGLISKKKLIQLVAKVRRENSLKHLQHKSFGCS